MLIEVMEEFAREGWIGLGWQIGRDSMHFQPTRWLVKCKACKQNK
jgi:hypothetical protein